VSGGEATAPAPVAARPSVALVVPGRRCAATIDACLDGVEGVRARLGEPSEVVFVDDGAADPPALRDDAAHRAASRPWVRVLPGPGRGPATARNLGWRASDAQLVWFIDADCLAEPDALEPLLEAIADPTVAAVGGSYGIANPGSLLARLIHEEILARHRRLARRLARDPDAVRVLGSYNVLYRRSALEAAGGFDETFLGATAEDADLALRVRAASGRLDFRIESRVRHVHPERWLGYLRRQREHGAARVRLQRTHRLPMGGDGYADRTDVLQPPLAVGAFGLGVAGLLLLGLDRSVAIGALGAAGGLLIALVGSTAPRTVAMIRAAGDPTLATYALLAPLRALARGVGILQGVLGGQATEDRPRGSESA